MKPFDLELALQGHPVVTRDGCDVEQITFFDCEEVFCVVGLLDGTIRTWLSNGRYSVIDCCDLDIFLADCDWQPEPEFGDLVEVRDCGDDVWTGLKFICKTPNGRIVTADDIDYEIYSYDCFEVAIYDEMRPIQKELNIKITVSINDKPAKLSDISDETLRKIKEAE